MASSVTSVPRFHRPAPVRRRRRFGVAPALAFVLVKAVAVVGVPLGLGAWLYASPYFLVQEIEVKTGERVPVEWVAATLAPIQGRHILGVSLESVRPGVEAHPWVASVKLRKELPDRLRVEVVERRPAALLRTDEGVFFVDAKGGAISPLPETTDAGGLVSLRRTREGSVPVAAALMLLAELEEAREGWGSAVTDAIPLGDGDFQVEVDSLPYSLILRIGTVAQGLERLAVVEEELSRRGVAMGTVDLRLPRRILVRPPATQSSPAKNHESARTEG